MVWPTVQLANFWLVPLQHRLMVVNTFALGKRSILHSITTRSHHEIEFDTLQYEISNHLVFSFWLQKNF